MLLPNTYLTYWQVQKDASTIQSTAEFGHEKYA